MKRFYRILALLLACLLMGASALAAGLDAPELYVGSWQGGDSYGEAFEYYLDLLDYRDGVFDAELAIYRIWSFDHMTALLAEDEPTAVLSTAPDDQYAVLATLDFSPDRIELTVLESSSPDLPAGTRVLFAPAKGE